MAPRRRISLALAALLVLAGCAGGAVGPEAPSSGQTSTGVTTSATTTIAAKPATETTAPQDCSLDLTASTLSNVSKPANLTRGTARNVAETVESRYQSARVEEHSYFNYHARVESAEQVESGYRVVISAELDYDHREDGTVTHVHRPYTVTYLVTDRQVVRRGEAGVTGTVACW